MTNATLPVAETFHSIQGEGIFAGAQMFFVRLAGCNVGRYLTTPSLLPKTFFHQKDATLAYSRQHSVCTSIDGQEFLCDTDYRKARDVGVEELLRCCWEHHLCITGGEPLLHDLRPLLEAANMELHIETSGTVPIPPEARATYITCSPKQGFLHENYHKVDQWKFVVGPSTDLGKIAAFLEAGALEEQPVYFQPLGGVSSAAEVGWVRALLELMHGFPQARLSLQLHKLLGMR